MFARVDSESSILRWFMSRHGDGVMAASPGLLARLAAGGGDVALVFRGDRVAAFAAWTATGAGEAELLAAYSTDFRVPPWAFLFGENGPFAAAGVGRVWLYADRPAQARGLREQGFVELGGKAGRGSVRLERVIGPHP
ncbi:MAG: hypothetical protein LBD97_04085 [Bifidobacteriaceae bacterium]|jgi:hypothetical protein|nr:hypothetical protein [Bifidobacteriaceae bacterium]